MWILSFLKCRNRPENRNGSKSIKWPTASAVNEVESTNIWTNKIHMKFFHSIPHTNVVAIIYIDVREFQKHNKKIVWLMVFVPAALFVRLSSWYDVISYVFGVCVCSIHHFLLLPSSYICMRTEAKRCMCFRKIRGSRKFSFLVWLIHSLTHPLISSCIAFFFSGK